MRHTITISILGLMAWTSAHADVPYIFQSGDPAVAGEVNANFQALVDQDTLIETLVNANSEDIATQEQALSDLASQITGVGDSTSEIDDRVGSLETAIPLIDGRVSDLEGRVSTLESATPGEPSDEITHNCQPLHNNQYHPIEYTAANSVVGQAIAIGGQEYRIVKVPFVEFGSGDAYTIMLPVKEDEIGTINSLITLRHDPAIPDCDLGRIGDWRLANFYTYDSRSINVRTRVGSQYESRVNYSLYASIMVTLNETTIYINAISQGVEEQRIELTPGDYDFTDDFDVSLMTHHEDLVSNLDELVDHISIEELP